MPPNPTRRQLLGLGPVMVALAAGAISPAFVRTYEGQRFTMVLTHDLPKHQRKPELDRAVERMDASLVYRCVSTSVRRIGERIVFGVNGIDEEENQLLADHMLRVAEPIQLRITAVDHGIIDVDLARERLPFS